MGETKIIKVKVGEGKEIAIEAALLEVTTSELTEARMGAINLPDMSSVCESIEAFASSINSTIAKVKPTKATVEFGFNIGVDNSNKVSAFLVSGKAEASINISLEWE